MIPMDSFSCSVDITVFHLKDYLFWRRFFALRREARAICGAARPQVSDRLAYYLGTRAAYYARLVSRGGPRVPFSGRLVPPMWVAPGFSPFRDAGGVLRQSGGL